MPPEPPWISHLWRFGWALPHPSCTPVYSAATSFEKENPACELKGSWCWVSVDTLDVPLSTLDQHFHQHLIDISMDTRSTRSTPWPVVDREVPNFCRHTNNCVDQYIHVWVSQHCQLSTYCRSTVDRVLILCCSRFWPSISLVPTEYRSRCWLTFDRVLIEMSTECRGYRLTVNCRRL